MKVLLTLAVAVLVGLGVGKFYFEARLVGVEPPPATTLHFLETQYDDVNLGAEHQLVSLYVDGYDRVHEDSRNGVRHRFARMGSGADAAYLLHAVPSLGVKSTTRWERNAVGATVFQLANCRGDRSQRRNIMGLEAYGMEEVAESTREKGVRYVTQVWRAPEVGCEVVERVHYDELPDGSRIMMKSLRLIRINEGVDQDMMAIDPSWREISPAAMQMALVKNRVEEAEYQEWLRLPSTEERLARLDRSYQETRLE